MIEARIVLDSINPAGKRITTWLLTYPRFIHSEFMTHRIFSRNSASSRAIPPEKLLRLIEDDPAMPNRYAIYAKGMGDGGPMNDLDRNIAETIILDLRDEALLAARSLQKIDSSKQIINRYLEPWMHMTVLATATNHENFFALRPHLAAEPNFQELAYKMLDGYLSHTPTQLQWGEWHLPGVTGHSEYDYLGTPARIKMCVALACRASYAAFDQPPSMSDADRIHDQGIERGHMSPFEHPAQAHESVDYAWSNFDNPKVCLEDPLGPSVRGLSYWMQYRKTIPNENRTNVDLANIRSECPEWIRNRIN